MNNDDLGVLKKSFSRIWSRIKTVQERTSFSMLMDSTVPCISCPWLFHQLTRLPICVDWFESVKLVKPDKTILSLAHLGRGVHSQTKELGGLESRPALNLSSFITRIGRGDGKWKKWIRAEFLKILVEALEAWIGSGPNGRNENFLKKHQSCPSYRYT